MPLGFSEIAASVGIDLRTLPATSRFLTYLSIEAALEHEGWKTAPELGKLKRWSKPARRRS